MLAGGEVFDSTTVSRDWLRLLLLLLLARLRSRFVSSFRRCKRLPELRCLCLPPELVGGEGEGEATSSESELSESVVAEAEEAVSEEAASFFSEAFLRIFWSSVWIAR